MVEVACANLGWAGNPASALVADAVAEESPKKDTVCVLLIASADGVRLASELPDPGWEDAMPAVCTLPYSPEHTKGM